MTDHEAEPDWRVLLIAGPSGTGKTTAARALGERLGISVLQVDELRLSLQRVTAATSHAALHRFLDPRADVWSDAEAYAHALWDVAEIVSRALEPVVEHRTDLPRAGPLIVEGDGVLPSLAHYRTRVRGLVVIERDRSALRARMAERGRGFDALSREAQAVSVEGSMRFGAMLEAAAKLEGVPVIEAHPLVDLAERILRTGQPS